MADPNFGAAFVVTVIWLALGGYAFGREMNRGRVESSAIFAVMLLCISLAPFAFGFSLAADMRAGNRNAE